VVTIGVFDGVHLGHQRVVAQAARRARDLGMPLVAVVLDPPPGEVTRPGTRTVRLTSPAYRTTLLAGLGADYVYALPFTYDLSTLTPEEFVRRIVVGELRAAVVVTGAGFRFGHDAAGDATLLAKLGEEHGFTAEAVETVTDDGAAVSAARTASRASWSVATSAAAARSGSPPPTSRPRRTPRSPATASTRAACGWAARRGRPRSPSA
jgi:riboflavin kinase/FMN adenylyltransferase